MRTTLTIAVHEFKTMYRRRMFQILTVGVPVAVLIALSVVWVIQYFGDDEGEKDKAGYVDGTTLFSGHLTQDDVEFVRYDSRDEGMDALLAEDVKSLYVHTAGTYLGYRAWVQRVEVGLGFDLNPQGKDERLSRFLLANLSRRPRRNRDVISRLKYPLFLTNVAVDPSGVPRDLDVPRVIFFVGLAVLLMFSLLMTGGFLLQGLGEEKESRIMEVLLSSVTPAQFMIGKVLGLGAAGLSQMLIWVAVGRTLLGVLPSVFTDLDLTLPGLAPMVVAVAFFVLGYFMFATLNAGLGAISSDESGIPAANPHSGGTADHPNLGVDLYHREPDCRRGEIPHVFPADVPNGRV